MSSQAFIRITAIFVMYVVLTQLIISGYNTKMNQMFKTNNDLIKSCSSLSEGVDLEENYVR